MGCRLPVLPVQGDAIRGAAAARGRWRVACCVHTSVLHYSLTLGFLFSQDSPIEFKIHDRDVTAAAAKSRPGSANVAEWSGCFPSLTPHSFTLTRDCFDQPSNALISHSQLLLPSVSKVLIATAPPNRRPPTTTPLSPPMCPPSLAAKQILWCARTCGQFVCGCLRGRWRRSLRRARILMRRRFLRLAGSSCTLLLSFLV